MEKFGRNFFIAVGLGFFSSVSVLLGTFFNYSVILAFTSIPFYFIAICYVWKYAFLALFFFIFKVKKILFLIHLVVYMDYVSFCMSLIIKQSIVENRIEKDLVKILFKTSILRIVLVIPFIYKLIWKYLILEVPIGAIGQVSSVCDLPILSSMKTSLIFPKFELDVFNQFVFLDILQFFFWLSGVIPALEIEYGLYVTMFFSPKVWSVYAKIENGLNSYLFLFFSICFFVVSYWLNSLVLLFFASVFCALALVPMFFIGILTMNLSTIGSILIIIFCHMTGIYQNASVLSLIILGLIEPLLKIRKKWESIF